MASSLAVFALALSQSQLLPAQGATCAAQPQGLVAWWPGNGTAADLAGGNDGVLLDGATYGAGEVHEGFLFDGIDDFVSVVPTATPLDGFSALTIDAWIDPHSFDDESYGNPDMIVSKYDSRSANGVSYYLAVTLDGRLRLAVFQTCCSSDAPAYAYADSDPGLVPLNEFTHVAGVWSGGQQLTLYLNGVAVPTTIAGEGSVTSIAANDSPVNIGRAESGAGSLVAPLGHFTGVIDEVHIFDRALAAEEVAAIHDARNAGICLPAARPSGMVAWWPGNGTAVDLAGGNDGVLLDGATYGTGEVHEGFLFDGIDDFVSVVPTATPLDGFSALTIDAWINPPSFDDEWPPGNANIVVSKYDSRSANGVSYYLAVTLDGRLRFAVFQTCCSSDAPAYAYADSDPGLVPLNEFTHVAGVWSGGQQLSLYLNGVAVPTTIAGEGSVTSIAVNDSPVNIGRGESGAGSLVAPLGHFTGIIDEVHIFDRALAAEEIAAIYDARSAGIALPATTTLGIDGSVASIGSSVGQPYAVAVTISGGNAPTGTIAVSDGAAACTIVLPASSCTLTSTMAGNKTITATYSGDNNNQGSSTSSAHVVARATPTLSIAGVAPDPSVVGSSYSVTTSLTGGYAATGSITVDDGAGATCTILLPATNCDLTSTTAGITTITASYSGDTNNEAASASAAHDVAKATPTLSIISVAPEPSAVGSSYTVTASLQGSYAATGSIAVDDGAGATCTISLPATSCSLTSTSAGAKTVTATYAGDANNVSATASTTHSISKFNALVTIVSHAPNPSKVGQAFTVVVGVSGYGTPSGTVVVALDKSGCTIALPNTSCVMTASSAKGTSNLTAAYSGDANNKSDKATVKHTVTP